MAVSRSIDEVTRASYSRGLPATTWISLVRQASSGKSAEEIEAEVTDSLLQLLRHIPPPPLAVQYLQQALQNVEHADGRPVRPGFIARQASIAVLPLSSAEIVFAILNATLSASPQEQSYTASTSDETAEGLLLVLDHLLPLTLTPPSAAPETARWISRFLSKPPHRLSKKRVSEELLEQCLAAAQQSLESLAGSNSEELVAVRRDLEAILSRLTSGARRRAAPPVSMDALSRALAYEPDAMLLVSSFLNNLVMPTSSAASQVSTFLRSRLAQTTIRGSTSSEALARGLADLLLPLLMIFGRLKREDKAIEGFLYGKLPRLLQLAISKPGLEVDGGESFDSSLVAVLQLVQSTMSSARVGDAMEVDGSSTTFDNFVIAICQHGLISPDSGASLAVGVDRDELELAQTDDYASRLSGGDPDAFKQLVEELLSVSAASHQAVSFAVRDNIVSIAGSSPPDLYSLISACEALSANPDTLTVLFLHVEPREVLAPLRRVLDEFDVAHDEFGDTNPVERYGALILFVEIVVARFKLHENLAYHLGSTSGFFVNWLPSSSATYPLTVLSEEERAAVSGWIAALFGEGISDDLMQATNPRTLLRVAPTILKQSLMACQAGIVDLDNLRDALSYFLQELLRFTLRGVLGWLTEEVAKSPSFPGQAAMIDILQVFIFSDSLPPPVLELISPDLAILISTLPPPGNLDTPTSSLDVEKLKRLIAPYKPLAPALEWSTSTGETWPAALSESLSALVDNPSPASSALPSLSHTLALALRASSSPFDFLRDSLIPHLFSLAVTTPESAPSEDALVRLHRIERAGSAILAFTQSSPPTAELPLLLSAFSRQLIAPSFAGWAGRRRPVANGIGNGGAIEEEQKKLELLADWLGGAVVLVAADEIKAEGLKRLLQQVEEQAVGAISSVTQSQKVRGLPAEVVEEEAEEGSTALRLFLDRLLSWSIVAERCPRLVEITS